MTATRALRWSEDATTISYPMVRCPTRLLLVAVASVGLAGCAAYDALVNPAPPPRLCPRISVIADATTVTKYRPGPGRDVTDIVLEGEITSVAVECRKLDSKTGGGQLTVELGLVMEAERGAADRDRRGVLEYFIGIADRERTIVRKEMFRSEVTFTGNVTRVKIADDPVTLRIPLKAGQTGADFEILIGFQLDRDELERNRRRTPTVP